MTIETRPQPIASRYITYEEYLAGEGDNPCSEWVNGKVLDLSLISDEHNKVSGFLLLLLQMWASEHQAGEVRYEPFNMKTGPLLSGRSPDVLFIAAAHQDRIRRNFLDGPADIVVEVISPESRQRNTVEKPDEYAQGGVPEYWLVDYENQQSRFYALERNGVYQEITIGDDFLFRSRVLPGLWLDTRWLFIARERRVLPECTPL